MREIWSNIGEELASDYEIILPTPRSSTLLPLSTKDSLELHSNSPSSPSKSKDKSKYFDLVINGELKEFSNLFESRKIKINMKDKHNEGFLHYATKGLQSNGVTEIFKYLLKYDSKVNLSNKSGTTPLHIASQIGNQQAVSMLIESKASPAICDKKKMTPLHLACKNGNLEILKILLPLSNVNQKNEEGETSLFLGIKSESIEVVTYMLQNGVQPFLLNKNESTPLHYAAKLGNLEIVKVILTHHYRIINCLDNHSVSACFIAIEEGNINVANYLIEKGADVRCGVIHPSFNKSFMKDRFVPSQLNYCKSENLSSLDLSK